MDAQLQELLEKIKEEGVKSAEERSAQIIHEAEKRAKEIVSKAHREASQIRSEAEKDAARFEQNGKAAIEQAGRNLVLDVQNQIQHVFERLIQSETAEAFKGKVLEDSIVALIEAWGAKEVQDLKVLLPESECERLEKSLRARLTEQIAAGLEIEASGEIDAGFYVEKKDGSFYYNFSEAGIREVLASYLNPRLGAVLKGQSQETREKDGE